MKQHRAFIVAARRAANGRVGGLHHGRRLEDLAAPIVSAVLNDAQIAPASVDEIIVGNVTAGGNPARLIALAAGLPETVPAYTIDRQCASGLDAILSAIRGIESGDADVVVAGGAESISTAPWRVAKPRNLYQLPRFLELSPDEAPHNGEPELIEASETLAKNKGIGRARQDAYAHASYERAIRAEKERRFVGEIVPIRIDAIEARDEALAYARTPDELIKLPPYIVPEGTVTPGNSSNMHDGAAFAVIVSEPVYEKLGRPSALRLVANAATGVTTDARGLAGVSAVRKLYQKLNGYDRSTIGVIEMGENSAAEAIVLEDELGLDGGIVNPDGGSIAHGLPYGASGAVLVTRLFSRLVRQRDETSPPCGAVVSTTHGGLGIAALFESV